jgi:hypothetical protein
VFSLHQNPTEVYHESLEVLLAMFTLFSPLALAQRSHVLPEGREIRVRTDTAIPAKPPANAKYSATVSNDVTDSSGALVIPRRSRAQLVAVPAEKDTNLDLRSVTVEGKRYLLTTQSAKGSGPGGLGANKRTAKYVGGGAAVGAVLGALLGGGKGAAIGALVGGAGALALRFIQGGRSIFRPRPNLASKLAQDLQRRPVRSATKGGLKTR